MKRSRWASGSANVPSASIGFWVAITMKGCCRRWVTESTVTCCSSMHSSNAAWVFALARLISSAITILAKTGPGWKEKSWACGENTDTPVTSLGSRSGVNWMRVTVQSTLRPRALASIVLPTPGTSSTSRCPPASNTTRAVWIASGLPSTTWDIESMMRWQCAPKSASTEGSVR